MARDDRKFYQYASAVLGERIALGDEGEGPRKDIMHYLLHARDPTTGTNFDRQQLNVESGLLIAAGAETTSLTLAAALFYLVRSPRVLNILTGEVRSVDLAGEVNEASTLKFMSLPYLRAVIHESLRLSPPVPSILPRELLPGGITIDGDWIPAGTFVGVSAYAIHRNPAYFPEPDLFYPERWIVDNDLPNTSSKADIPRRREAVSIARQAFFAFSQGSRACIGRQLAYYELHITLALLLCKFDIRLTRDSRSGTLLKDSTSWREGLTPVLDPKEEDKDQWREERQNADEFQLFDRFLSDRNGPMLEFRSRGTGG